MKKIILILTAIACFANVLSAQESKNQLPTVTLKTMDGKNFNTNEIQNDGKPIIICFWATWCKPCVKELNAMNEYYADWKEETGVKVVAISLDDSRSSGRVQPVVNAQGWEYDILLDQNGDFKRAMNVANPPHTFILDGTGKVVWQHTSYAEGGELEYINVVRKIIKGEPIE